MRIGTAIRATMKGEAKLIDEASASGMNLTPEKKQVVEASRTSERPICTLSRTERKMRQPMPGPKSSSTKRRCEAVRAQMICSVE